MNMNIMNRMHKYKYFESYLIYTDRYLLLVLISYMLYYILFIINIELYFILYCIILYYIILYYIDMHRAHPCATPGHVKNLKYLVICIYGIQIFEHHES